MKKLALIPTLLFVVVMTMGASMAFYYFDASQITSGTLSASRLPAGATTSAPQNTTTVTWTTSATELWANIPAGTVDAQKLAGNVAATYTPSKATIEALLTGSITTHDHKQYLGNDLALAKDINKTTIEAVLTGQIQSHTHNADHITGGQVTSNQLPDSISTTSSVTVGTTLTSGTAEIVQNNQSTWTATNQHIDVSLCETARSVTEIVVSVYGSGTGIDSFHITVVNHSTSSHYITELTHGINAGAADFVGTTYTGIALAGGTDTIGFTIQDYGSGHYLKINCDNRALDTRLVSVWTKHFRP